jgi:hypothetical protein
MAEVVVWVMAVAFFGGAAVSAVFVVKPRWRWRLDEGWRYADPDAVEEQYLFHDWASLGAAGTAVVLAGCGVAALVWWLPAAREAGAQERCERVMEAFRDAHWAGEPPLEEVAAEHGVEIRRASPGSGLLDVYDGDQLIGSMIPPTDEFDCAGAEPAP